MAQPVFIFLQGGITQSSAAVTSSPADSGVPRFGIVDHSDCLMKFITGCRFRGIASKILLLTEELYSKAGHRIAS